MIPYLTHAVSLAAAFMLLSVQALASDQSELPPKDSETKAEEPVSKRGDSELDTLKNRPHRSLTAMASQRVDHLSKKENWTLKPNLTLHKLLDLPSWASLAYEERFRYENYGTPWRNGDVRGQWSVPMQSVVFGEIRPTDDLRFSAEFWDARQWGPSDPNKISDSMVNTLNFSQLYAAVIGRNLMGSSVDGELKAGQMTMLLGSARLISRYSFRNTQQSYVGMQARFRQNRGDWELVTFANVPEQLLPQSDSALLANRAVWNRPMTDSYFAGYFLTGKLQEDSHLETYLYSLKKGYQSNGYESMMTPGFRIYREVQKSGFDYEVESVGQFGRYQLTSNASSANIAASAIMEHVQVAYSWGVLFQPRIQFEWDYASPYFNPLFGQSVFDFGPSGILGFFSLRNNINSPGVRFLFNPRPDVFVYTVYRQWWLADGRALTGWSNANLVDTTGKAGSHVGQSVEVSARWDLDYNLAFQTGWQILMKGRFAEMAPGAPTDHGAVNYFYVETQFRI